VQLGSKVTVEIDGQEKTFSVVNQYESDPSKGKISDISPIGRALMGRKLQEKISVELPKGTQIYTLRNIE
jgi:transcription elongation factor GreA